MVKELKILLCYTTERSWSSVLTDFYWTRWTLKIKFEFLATDGDVKNLIYTVAGRKPSGNKRTTWGKKHTAHSNPPFKIQTKLKHKRGTVVIELLRLAVGNACLPKNWPIGRGGGTIKITPPSKTKKQTDRQRLVGNGIGSAAQTIRILAALWLKSERRTRMP